MQHVHSRLLEEENREELVLSLAAAAGVPIPDGCLPGVCANLVVAAGMAALLFDCELDDGELALANVFNPGPGAPE